MPRVGPLKLVGHSSVSNNAAENFLLCREVLTGADFEDGINFS